MNLLIVGSRKIEAFDLSPYIANETVDLIITGGAQGVDSLAEEYADQHQISKLVLRPQYKKFGRAAPLKRNEQMVALADQILIIWDGKSKGTQYTLDYAKRQNRETRLVVICDLKS